MLVLWLVGCGVEAPSEVEELLDTGEEVPSEYVVAPGESTAVLSVEEVAAGIESGLETMRLLDPAILQAQYLELIADGDAAEEGCPEWRENFYEGEGYNYWKDTCTSEEGTLFSGWAKQQRPMEYQNGNHHYTDDGYLEGEFEISRPGGARLEFSGKVSYYERINNYYYYTDRTDFDRYYYVDAWGDATLQTSDGDANWLTESYVYDYNINFQDYDDDDGMKADWEGGIFGITGDAPAIHATDFYIYSAANGSPCEKEPSGLISIRDTQGQWYDVEFQGPPYNGAWSYQPACDGCGEVWFRGEFMGETCVDFSIFMEWNGEGRPW